MRLLPSAAPALIRGHHVRSFSGLCLPRAFKDRTTVRCRQGRPCSQSYRVVIPGKRRREYVHADQAEHRVRPRDLGGRFVLQQADPPLQAEGYEVISAQYGLDSNEADVAATRRTLSRVSSPAILVGHSYGGAVITAAGTDDRVAGLVYIAPSPRTRPRPRRASRTSSPSRTPSSKSRLPTGASGCSRQASGASPVTCPKKSRK